MRVNCSELAWPPGGLQGRAGGFFAEGGSPAPPLLWSGLRCGLRFDVCISNAEMVAAIEELEAGGGRVFAGPTNEVFETILREEE